MKSDEHDFSELLKRSRGNYVYYIITAFKLIIKSFENQPLNQLNLERKTLSICNSIFRGRATAEVFLYLCKNGASTSWVLQVQLNMSEATTFNALKRLRSSNIVEPMIRIMQKKGTKGGPRPTIWGLIGCTNEEIAGAINLHHRCMSPKYRLAEEIAQKMLKEYIIPKGVNEISLLDIVKEVKMGGRKFQYMDVANLAAQYLHEEGIKIWR